MKGNGEAWAAVTRSPIDIPRSQHSHTPAIKVQPGLNHGSVATLLLFALLSLIASLNMENVYGSWALWGLTAVGSVGLGGIIALAARSSSASIWVQLALLILAQFVIGPILALNSTTLAGIVPSTQTLVQGFIDTFGSFKYVISVNPPLGSSGGGLMALWTTNLWLGFLASVMSIGVSRLSICLSPLPVFANMAVSALLGTSEGLFTAVRGVAIALLLVVWMSIRLGHLEMQRLMSSVVVLALAAGVALGSSFLIPADRFTLRGSYDPPLNLHQFSSPLSGMRSYVRYHKKDKLLTVTGLPAGTPVRLAAMDRFDGNVWNLSDSKSAADSSDYRRVGSRIGRHADQARGPAGGNGTAQRFTATFEVHQGLGEQWLPLAGSADGVSFTHGSSPDEFYFNSSTDTGIYSTGLHAGQRYIETGDLKAEPTAAQIAKSPIQTTTQPKARDAPDAASKLAPALAGEQTTGGQTAQKLSDSLQRLGWFSHGLTGDYPSLPGHGSYRIESLLGETMVGDSEQYASAMALMARELGLPSRVVLGFIPKDKDGRTSKSRTQGGPSSQGNTKVSFTGNDIEAWVEIDLKNWGWTAFYPTPRETKTPDKDQDPTPPNPKNLVRQPPVPLVDPLYDKMQAREHSGANGDDANKGNGNSTLGQVLTVARTVMVYGSPVWALALIRLIILALKAAQIASLRRTGSPRHRISSGWRAITMAATQSGANLEEGGTRLEQAETIARSLGLDDSQVAQAGREADWAAYSGQSVDDHAAETYWKTADRLRELMVSNQHGWRRIRTKLSLKGVLPRHKRAKLRKADE